MKIHKIRKVLFLFCLFYSIIDFFLHQSNADVISCVSKPFKVFLEIEAISCKIKR